MDITSEFLREIESHTIIISDCVTRCFGITKDPESNNFIMVMEYAEHGSLRQYLNDTFNSIKWVDKLQTLKHIVQGLDSIHEKGLIHRDFHCEPKNAIDNKDDDNSIGKYSESIEDSTKLNLDEDN
ncbi:kinase-like domain-containing protein [Rhizophagus irregularis DAOM 181602=DAOM 197198]|nr:kinase-like domain-containing protein [Rhizophagus irregularis DAOM 181602=DAOM 197198]